MIATATNLELIEDVVSEWVAEGRMFTAFEVSLALKERGVRERHRHLREDVHQIICRAGATADYTRTLRDVGAPEQAWVYHRAGDNPFAYQPLDRSDFDAAVPYVVPGIRNAVRLSANLPRPHAVPPGAFGTDQRGRVCIPVTLLARLGVGPGQRVDVLCDPANAQVLVTRPAANPGADADTSYTVEPDGNVRISQGTLLKAGIHGLQCYRIEGTASVITLREFEW
jgi:hypothetical protein